MNKSPIQNGEIRHVTKNPDVIIKVNGPFNSETFGENGKATKLDTYIQTNEFPKYHFVVILDEIESYTSPGHKFFISKLITHNSGYGNLKITEDLYDRDSTTIDLKNSFITRDKFLIPVNEVMPEKIYGIFDLLKLEDKSEY
jgi:hypothetical protein